MKKEPKYTTDNGKRCSGHGVYPDGERCGGCSDCEGKFLYKTPDKTDYSYLDFCWLIARRYWELPNGEYSSRDGKWNIEKCEFRTPVDKLPSPSRLDRKLNKVQIQDDLTVSASSIFYLLAWCFTRGYYLGSYIEADSKTLELCSRYEGFMKKDIVENFARLLSTNIIQANIDRIIAFTGFPPKIEKTLKLTFERQRKRRFAVGQAKYFDSKRVI